MNLDRLTNAFLLPSKPTPKKQMQVRLPDETHKREDPNLKIKPKGYLYIGKVLKTNDELKAERNGRLLKEDA